jgi:hypothetical protein
VLKNMQNFRDVIDGRPLLQAMNTLEAFQKICHANNCQNFKRRNYVL